MALPSKAVEEVDKPQVEPSSVVTLVQSTLSVRFTTSIADKSLRVEDAIYTLPSKLTGNALSEVINHLLPQQSDESSDLIEFDFLINNIFIRNSIAEHLKQHSISSEKTITIEYIEKTTQPSVKSSNQHPDWVCCVDVLGRNTSRVQTSYDSNLFISGCYDGIVRVWDIAHSDAKDKRGNKATALHRCHLSPIKDITSLYSDASAHYFATASKDRCIKVFEYSYNTDSDSDNGAKKIREIALNKSEHRFGVECISAPAPSKLFATGGIDRDIKIFRVPGGDTVQDVPQDDDTAMEAVEPPAKRRRINPQTEEEKLIQSFTKDESSSDNDNDATTADIAMTDNQKSGIKKLRARDRYIRAISTLPGHREKISVLDWNNPLALYSASWDQTIRLWDVSREIDVYSWQTQSAVHAMKFWGQQNLLISAHSNSKICVWDPRTDATVVSKTSKHTYRSHRLPITSIACSQNNGLPLFISGSHDGKVKFWDLRSSEPLFEVARHNGKVLCVDWCGNTVVSGGSDNKLFSYKWKL